MGITEIVEFVKLSKKTQVSLLMSCLLIILLAQFNTLLNDLAIKSIVNSILPLISFIAIVLIGFIFSTPIYDFFDQLYTTKRYKMRMLEHIKHLTNDEKEVLIKYLKSNKRVINFSIEDGVINSLESESILFRASNVATLYRLDYGIQDMALDILKQLPEYLEINYDK